MSKLKLGLAVIGASAAISLAAAPVSAEPNLTIPESIFDFVYAPQNSKISTVFWLKSTGDDTLKILKVVPG